MRATFARQYNNDPAGAEAEFRSYHPAPRRVATVPDPMQDPMSLTAELDAEEEDELDGPDECHPGSPPGAPRSRGAGPSRFDQACAKHNAMQATMSSRPVRGAHRMEVPPPPPLPLPSIDTGVESRVIA